MHVRSQNKSIDDVVLSASRELHETGDAQISSEWVVFQVDCDLFFSFEIFGEFIKLLFGVHENQFWFFNRTIKPRLSLQDIITLTTFLNECLQLWLIGMSEILQRLLNFMATEHYILIAWYVFFF